MLRYIKVLIVVFIPFCLTGQEEGNGKVCNFSFNSTIKKNDSIPLFSEFGKLITNLTQSEFDSVVVYIDLDKSLNGRMRIKLIGAFILYQNDNIDVLGETSTDSITELYSNYWIENKYLATVFSEWVYDETLDTLGINQLFLYSRPTTHSEQTLLNGREWLLFKKESVSFVYRLEILECNGQWIKVKIIDSSWEFTGWMPWYNFCRSVLTLCHHLPEDGVGNEE